MTVREAIARADEMRPNTLSDEQKASFIYELDCDIAELQGVDQPSFVWPGTDATLLMEEPHDNIYVLYLAAKIDYYNQESSMYANDMAVFNSAYSETRAWWRRQHVPEKSKNWSVM